MRTKGDCGISVQLYNKYLELEPIGPVISGDLVVEGVTLSCYGPAMCCVEYAADHDESYSTISTIPPWAMMYTPSPSGDDEGGSSFAIPIKVPANCCDGTIRIRIYVTHVEKIPYEDASDEFELDPTIYVCAIEIMKSTKDSDDLAGNGDVDVDAEVGSASKSGSRTPINAMNVTNEGIDPSDAVDEELLVEDPVIVRKLHFVFDIDELEQLYSQNFELHILEVLSDGIVKDDIPHNLKFYIAAEMGLASNGGVEDVSWVRTQKSTGNIPKLDGYEIILEDLSNIDDDVSDE